MGLFLSLLNFQALEDIPLECRQLWRPSRTGHTPCGRLPDAEKARYADHDSEA